MVTQVEPLHFYQARGGDICMVLLATKDEVLYVSYESAMPGTVAAVSRVDFAERHEMEVPSPYGRAVPEARTLQ